VTGQIARAPHRRRRSRRARLPPRGRLRRPPGAGTGRRSDSARRRTRRPSSIAARFQRLQSWDRHRRSTPAHCELAHHRRATPATGCCKLGHKPGNARNRLLQARVRRRRTTLATVCRKAPRTPAEPWPAALLSAGVARSSPRHRLAGRICGRSTSPHGGASPLLEQSQTTCDGCVRASCRFRAESSAPHDRGRGGQSVRVTPRPSTSARAACGQRPCRGAR